MPDIADFLGSWPPFDAVGPDDLARIAAVTELESCPAGKTIFAQGAGPVAWLWVVRSGSVEIIHDGRVLDLLGPGELFGHASMISGLPTGFEARAAEETVCCRIPASVIRPLLAQPDVLGFVARSLVAGRGGTAAVRVPAADPVGQHVAALIRMPPLLCGPSTAIREAAQRMTAEGASAVLVRAAGALGIVTDRDLRSRVIAAGVSPDAPVSAVMTEPAYTVTADRLGDVLLDMLGRNVHHVPVLGPSGDVLGVVDDGDLVAAGARQPFLLRRAIGLAGSTTALVPVSAGLGPMIVALRDAGVAAEQVAAIRSVVLDALTQRLVELAVAEIGAPPTAFTWFALGSLARYEAVPSSDVDSALAWQDDDAGPVTGDYLARLAHLVDDGLRACGMQPDPHGASAANPQFARSLASWQAAMRNISENPSREQALILLSLITDSRPVYGAGPAAAGAGPHGAGPHGAGPYSAGPHGPGPQGAPVADALWEARGHPDLQRLLARFALSFRPPTGFLRDFVVEHSGERRGQLDIKHGGLIPIVDLARWAGMAAGVASAPTVTRLRAAEAAGTLDGPAARTLIEAFGFIFTLRLDHQVEQVRRGGTPDDFIDPRTLNPLARSYLREAFRAVASVQSGLAAELSLGVRWG